MRAKKKQGKFILESLTPLRLMEVASKTKETKVTSFLRKEFYGVTDLIIMQMELRASFDMNKSPKSLTTEDAISILKK
jgi:DNA topoisomerase VI subunit B